MSTTINYTIKRDNLILKYLNEEAIKKDDFLYGQYNIVSANLHNFLPEIDSETHMKLFTQLLIHKQLSKLEQGMNEALEFLTTENLSPDILEILKSKPAIICTFHTGSYRIINSFLVQNKIPYSLVIGRSILAAEGENYISLYHSLAGKGKNAGFTIIDAENPRSGLQMLRELKAGKKLLLYLDGNSGAGIATTKNENRCVIDFLQQQIFARKGIGFLAHTANVPIIPVVNYRERWDDIRLRFYDVLIPNTGEERNSFAMRVTQHLYDVVSPVIRQYPQQWEALLYLHKVANIVTPAIPSRGNEEGKFVRFNLRDFGLFCIKETSFLFQKSDYTSYPINVLLYNILKRSIDKPVNKKKVDRVVLKELEEKGVLHYL